MDDLYCEQGGELVGVLRGANAPLLQRMIVQKLGEEKMVLEKGVERKVVSHEINMYSVSVPLILILGK